MDIKDLTVPQKIILAIGIITVIALCVSAISSSVKEEKTVTVYDVTVVELYTNYSKYQGEYVRFAAPYETIISEHNALTFVDGLADYRQCIYAWMEKGHLPKQTEDYSAEYVLITGKVKDMAVGNLNVYNCKLEAIGEEAYEFYRKHKN